jgi:hypothetical protein
MRNKNSMRKKVHEKKESMRKKYMKKKNRA